MHHHVSLYLKLAITRVSLSSGNIYSRFYQKCRYACQSHFAAKINK